MTSWGEKIAKLTNPCAQVILDPEDAVELDSAAKVFTEEVKETQENEISELRRKTAPLLEDVDPTYAGRKVSRRDLGPIFHEDDKSSPDDNDSAEEIDEDVSYSEDDDGDVSDDEMKNFKELIASKSKEHEEEDSYEDEEEDNYENEEEESSEEEETENKASDEMTKQFSNIDVTTELEKSQAINNQKEIMNRLLETRIKLQKLLIIVNKLPQFSVWNKLKEKGGKEFCEQLSKGSQSINQVMKLWMNLQTELVNRNREIQCSSYNASEKNDEEEIPSETDDEIDINCLSNDVETKGIKRKRKKENFEMTLAKHFKSLIPYRNSVIQKWDEKTKLSSGRTQKSFSAFDNSALKQIEQNLQDKSRLIKRTQLKRSVYRILGKSESSNLKSAEDNEEEMSVSKQDMLLKDYDSEIFDDDDFYRQILKDVIESKSFGVDAAAIRKQMDIQKIRNKMKRKVDTKASKGRKLRYDAHPKIENFQAQIQNSEMPDEARNSFIKCLFAGMNSTVS